MRIDAHQHFWKLSRGDYGWMGPELGPIYRDFLPADLEPLRKAAGVEKTIVVQAADTVAETEFLLGVAEATESIAGVVGWVDMEAGDAIATLEWLAQNPNFKGIRPMIQDIEDDEWVLCPSLDPVFDALIEMGLSFDALVLPRHLHHLQTRLDKHPDLACVINHAAKPALATGELDHWRKDMASISANSGALCKLSGLLTEAGDSPSLEAVSPAAEYILEAFGPRRIMFGSDWPVLNLAGDYAVWVQMVDTLLEGLDAADAARIWGSNAKSFYRVS
ncbi:amidohydrolase family protein [Aliiroseovarius subalbicans]|uniref:amidohydrolase family protein n=1 Tax=Aliiroseovarius subalbicans TaxID=2925840 RepID=UPI001F5667A2|nr:amidohydrolase family protein [Aliiroseovarius subalbicans]MCI2400905.1 amidohydrolase family protein [Aliiroseovarius subalbicans]